MRIRPALLAGLAALAVACSGMRTSPDTRYVGMLLDARDLGAQELQRLAAERPAVREALAREGQPDFVLLASPADLELIYTHPSVSKIVLVRQPDPATPAVTGTLTPLPTSIMALLPADMRAGTGEPYPNAGNQCWTITAGADRCRTCCVTNIACTIDCRAASGS